MSLRVILVDWDGTISVSRFWQHRIDEDPESYNKSQKALFIENPGMIHDWMRGYIVTERIINEVAVQTGIDYQHLMSGLEKSCKSIDFFVCLE